MKDPAQVVVVESFLTYELYPAGEDAGLVLVPRSPVSAASTYLVPLTSSELPVSNLLEIFQARYSAEVVVWPFLHPGCSGLGR